MGARCRKPRRARGREDVSGYVGRLLAKLSWRSRIFRPSLRPVTASRTGGRWFLHASVDRGPSAFHRTTSAAGLRASGAFLPACAQAPGWFWNCQTSREFVSALWKAAKAALLKAALVSVVTCATNGWASFDRAFGFIAAPRATPPGSLGFRVLLLLRHAPRRRRLSPLRA